MWRSRNSGSKRSSAWICSSVSLILRLRTRLLQPEQSLVAGLEAIEEPHAPHPARTDLEPPEHQLVGHSLGPVGGMLERMGCCRAPGPVVARTASCALSSLPGRWSFWFSSGLLSGLDTFSINLGGPVWPPSSSGDICQVTNVLQQSGTRSSSSPDSLVHGFRAVPRPRGTSRHGSVARLPDLRVHGQGDDERDGSQRKKPLIFRR